MSLEVQLYQIRPITEQEKQDNITLKNYEYLQYMGLNEDAAILCSIIHYAFIRKYQNILDSIQELIISSKIQSSYKKIADLIKETKNLLNPVQKFFQNLYTIDLKNECAQNILIELSQKKRLTIKINQSFDNIYAFRIFFQNSNESFGSQYKDQIELFIEKNKKFFYLIPKPIIYDLQLQYCQQCKTNSEMINLDCKHLLCCKCLIMKPNSNYIKCCNKIYQTKQLQNKLEQIDKIKELNQRSKALQTYYESTKNSVQNSQQQIQKYDNNKNTLIQADPLQECNQCFKNKYKTQLFIVKKCKHQYCYDCLTQSKFKTCCLIATCIERIDLGELQNYLNQYKKENNDIEVLNQSEKKVQQNSNYFKGQETKINEECSKCKTILTYKLFQIKKCKHRICNNCLQGIEIKQQLTYNCLISTCIQKFTKLEYKDYIQYLQDLSKLEELKSSVNIPAQNNQQFECDNCFKIQSEDIKYVLNCGHILCQNCILKNQSFRKCCIQASQVEEYQNFRKTLKINCAGCKNMFLIINLFELNCGHKFCLLCCQKIYFEKPQRCLVKYCYNSIYFIEKLNNFIIDQVKQESQEIQLKKDENVQQNLNEDQQRKEIVDDQFNEEAKVIEKTNRNHHQDNKNEEEKSVSAQNSVITIKEIQKVQQVNSKKEEITQQPKQKKQHIYSNKTKIKNPFLNDQSKNKEKQSLEDHSVSEIDSEEEFFISQQLEEIIIAQEMVSEFCIGNCTKCNQEFSKYNRKQMINCKLHEIGVCCSLIQFKDCPQCEEGLQKQTKNKFIIKKIPLEEEFIFESTIKSTSQNYNPQLYQQTYQEQYANLQNKNKNMYNQGSAIKRNITIDPTYKRVSESQQLLDDKALIRNEIRNHNELTLLRSRVPIYQQSYNTHHYEKFNYGRYNSGSLQGQFNRDLPLEIRYNSRFQAR